MDKEGTCGVAVADCSKDVGAFVAHLPLLSLSRSASFSTLSSASSVFIKAAAAAEPEGERSQEGPPGHPSFSLSLSLSHLAVLTTPTKNTE